MTRTERATSPRAIIKDRSESKSGIDKRTPKNGGGPHNWGRLEDERDLEEAALYDEEREFDEEAAVARPEVPRRKSSSASSSPTLIEQERGEALKFRKHALKSQDIDLAKIARTSAAVSTSPDSTVPIMSDADTANHR